MWTVLNNTHIQFHSISPNHAHSQPFTVMHTITAPLFPSLPQAHVQTNSNAHRFHPLLSLLPLSAFCLCCSHRYTHSHTHTHTHYLCLCLSSLSLSLPFSLSLSLHPFSVSPLSLSLSDRKSTPLISRHT